MNIELLNDEIGSMELDNPIIPSNEERLTKAKANISKYLEKQATALESIMNLNEQLEQPNLTEQDRAQYVQLEIQWQAKLNSIQANVKNLQDFRDSIEVEIAQAEKEAARLQQEKDKVVKGRQNDMQANEKRFYVF